MSDFDHVYVSDVEKRLIALHEGLAFILENIDDECERRFYQNMILTLSVGFPEIKRAKEAINEAIKKEREQKQ